MSEREVTEGSCVRNIRYSENTLDYFTPRRLRLAQTLVVSDRGQITLPARVRKRMGIKGGDVMILEDRPEEIVLRPGIVLEYEFYSDEQIAEWDAADTLDDQERERLLEAVARLK